MKTKRILAAVSFESEWERQILSGLTGYAREQNLHWEIRATARGSKMPELVEQMQPDGILCHPHMPIPEESLQSQVVYFHWQDTHLRPLLLIDNQHVGQLAAEHLLSRQFSRFCFVGNLNRPYAVDRFHSFKQSLKNKGYSASAFNTNGTFLGLLNSVEDKNVTDQFKALIDTLGKPLGIFAADDYEAHTAFEICRRAGWKIPENIGILGVNNDELVCRACDPMLSSIRIPYRQIGLNAGELLQRQFEGAHSPKKPVLFKPIEVIERRSTASNKADDPIVEQALCFIADHLAGPITTQDLLNLTGISRSMLERHFKQAINRTPYFEILHQRIERSKLLLRDTPMNIHEISTQCGFNSTNRFCQAFKNKTELTPSRYREACKNK